MPRIYIIILVSIASLIVGYALSCYANKKTEQRIIAAFKDELKKHYEKGHDK